MTIPLVPNGMGLDRALAALFCHAQKGETISLIMAQGEAAGRKWPCLACKFLGWTVETNHCQKVLAGMSTGQAAAFRAGAMLFALVISAGAVLFMLFRLMQII